MADAYVKYYDPAGKYEKYNENIEALAGFFGDGAHIEVTELIQGGKYEHMKIRFERW